MLSRFPIIGVMGSHELAWDSYATPLGRLIAHMDYHLLTGAGAGVMTTVAKAFTEEQERDGLSIGIVPVANYEGGLLSSEIYPNPYIELPILAPLDARAQSHTNPYSKNYVNVMTSNAVVVLPGDQGTRNEVSLAIQFRKPVILFGPEEAFGKFPEQPTRVQDIEEVRLFLEKATAKFKKDS